MKKSLFFILISVILGCFTACDDRNTPSGGGGGGGGGDTTPASEFVDLGLPSGTLWKNTNEVNKNETSGLFSYSEAYAKYGDQLPTKDQCYELIENCTWTWKGNAFLVTGPNKKTITLPADGFVEGDTLKTLEAKGKEGYYWTSETYDRNNAWCLMMEHDSSIDFAVDWTEQNLLASVRLIKNASVPPVVGDSILTVSEMMNIYSKLALAPGNVSAETYTVRGYVTQWNSGYPDYQNADFWIDDSATGSTSLLRCFRLVGLYDSDKHALNVGDYVEVQNCYIMNYNGTAELKEGKFTVLRSASPGGSTLGSQVSDFVGTWSCYQYNVNNSEYVTKEGVKIYTWTNSDTGGEWIAVMGLAGYNDQQALGEYDSYNKVLRLYSDYYFTSDIYTYNDTSYVDIFYPICVVYSGSSWNGHVVNDGGNYGMGEAWLSFDSAGRLVLGGSNTADSNGRYANGYAFAYYRNNNFGGWYSTYTDVVLTKTSSSVSAPARQMKMTRWHAPMALPKRTTSQPAAHK